MIAIIGVLLCLIHFALAFLSSEIKRPNEAANRQRYLIRFHQFKIESVHMTNA